MSPAEVAPDPEKLAADVRLGDVRAASRLMRLVDDGHPAALAALSSLYRGTLPAAVVGVTGSPGTGKSTLIDQLIAEYRKRGERVGVVAVDPSSPLSGGAILADRARMQRHALDPGVFIRSLANRGQQGGLSISTPATIAILEALGFGRILVETVGSGQSDVEIARVAGTTAVVLAPGLGDELQALKAGLMEIADVYVVNKADRPGADRAVRDVEAFLDGSRGADEWRPPVITTVATTGEGVAFLVEALERHRQHSARCGLDRVRHEERATFEIETLLLARVREEVLSRVGGEAAIHEAASRVAARVSDPIEECARLLVRRG